MKGCIRILPRFLNYYYQQENGALLYVSEKGLDTLWTKLYLFNEPSKNFKMVYDDSGMSPLGTYGSRILGPLRIWQINYPDDFVLNETLKERYLSRSTPEWLSVNEVSPLRQ